MLDVPLRCGAVVAVFIIVAAGNLSRRQVQIFRRNPLFQHVQLAHVRDTEPLDRRFVKQSKLVVDFMKVTALRLILKLVHMTVNAVCKRVYSKKGLFK